MRAVLSMPKPLHLDIELGFLGFSLTRIGTDMPRDWPTGLEKDSEEGWP